MTQVDPIVLRPPIERAQVALARAALLVDIAARALAELGSESVDVALSRRYFRPKDDRSLAEQMRYGQWPDRLDMTSCVRLAIEYGEAGAQLHDWAASLAAWRQAMAEKEPSER